MKPKWGIVTDEVLPQAADAVARVAGWNLAGVEIRGVAPGRRIPDIDPDEVRALQDALARASLSVTALSPGTWKCSLDAPEASLQAARFQRTLDLAEAWGVTRVITFGVKRKESDTAADYDRVCALLGQMSLEAGRRGITLCVENEKGWWADTDEAIDRLLTDLAPAGLRLNWDAANYADAGGTDPVAAYRRWQNQIANIHLKDVCLDPGGHRWCLLGQGDVGWETLLPVMLASPARTPMSIETHCAPLPDNSLLNRKWLQTFEITPQGGNRHG